jgi:hypothetical protein
MCWINFFHGFRKETLLWPETYQFFFSASSFFMKWMTVQRLPCLNTVGYRKSSRRTIFKNTRLVCLVTSLILQILFTSLPLIAQTGFGARAMGMGGTGMMPQNDSWAVFNNPAALPDSGTVFSFYGTRYFGFDELTETAFSMSAGLFGVRAGLGAFTFGFGKYRESGFRMAAGIPVSIIEAGLAVEWRHISIENYSSASALMLDAGLVLHPGGGISIAGVAGNVAGSTIGSSREPLPVVSSIGIGWQIFSNLTITGAAVKDNRFSVSWRIGTEYRPVPYLDLRSGAMTGPEQFHMGIGIRLKPVITSVAVMNHTDLGWTPSVEMTVVL